MIHKHFIQPNWPAPPHIKAYTTLRTGGVSLPPYDSFNLGDNTGDTIEQVNANRARLNTWLALPAEPVWIKQVHGTHLIEACPEYTAKEADAVYTHTPNQVCAVLTADCL